MTFPDKHCWMSLPPIGCRWKDQNGIGNEVTSLRGTGRSSALAPEPDSAPALKDKLIRKGSLPPSEDPQVPKAQSQVSLAHEVMKKQSSSSRQPGCDGGRNSRSNSGVMKQNTRLA